MIFISDPFKQQKCSTWLSLFNCSENLNTGLVWFKNGGRGSDCQIVQVLRTAYLSLNKEPIESNFLLLKVIQNQDIKMIWIQMNPVFGFQYTDYHCSLIFFLLAKEAGIRDSGNNFRFPDIASDPVHFRSFSFIFVCFSSVASNQVDIHPIINENRETKTTLVWYTDRVRLNHQT